MALLHCAISSLRRPRSPWTRPARGCGCRRGTERSPAQRGAAEGAGATIGGATIVAANVMGVGAAAMIGGAKRGDAGAMTSAAVTTVAETTTAAATAVTTEGGSRYDSKNDSLKDISSFCCLQVVVVEAVPPARGPLALRRLLAVGRRATEQVEVLAEWRTVLERLALVHEDLRARARAPRGVRARIRITRKSAPWSWRPRKVERGRCRLAVVGGASRGVGGGEERAGMRSCERCFCAAGFAQTWPPWSMRVSEKSSSNEKEGDATQGTQRAKHERSPEPKLR